MLASTEILHSKAHGSSWRCPPTENFWGYGNQLYVCLTDGLSSNPYERPQTRTNWQSPVNPQNHETDPLTVFFFFATCLGWLSIHQWDSTTICWVCPQLGSASWGECLVPGILYSLLRGGHRPEAPYQSSTIAP